MSEVELPSGGSRTLQVQERPTHPTLLSALGARRAARQEWDGRARRLRLSVSAAPGTPVRFTIYSDAPVKAVTNDRGQAVAFTWSPDTRLAHVSVAHEEGDRIDVSF